VLAAVTGIVGYMLLSFTGVTPLRPVLFTIVVATIVSSSGLLDIRPELTFKELLISFVICMTASMLTVTCARYIVGFFIAPDKVRHYFFVIGYLAGITPFYIYKRYRNRKDTSA